MPTIVLVGVAMLLGGLGLTAMPGSVAWWLLRLPRIAVMFAIPLLFIAVLGRFENPSVRKPLVTLPAWRVIAGSLLLSAGLALLAT